MSEVTFNSLPPYKSAGDIVSAGEMAKQMGYDPERHWEAGDRPADVFTLGDFQSSLSTQELNLDQIAQLSGLQLEGLRIADVPFFDGKTLAEVVDAVPALKDFTLEEIPALAEVIDFDLSATLGEMIDADELLGELNFSEILGDFSIMDIPNLDLTTLNSFKEWQAVAVSEIPGLGDIDLGALAQLPNVFSGVTATHDISFGPKENTKTPTRHSITGSDKEGFAVQCVQPRGCAHVELAGAGKMHGAQWIAGGKGEGQQMVEGGEGILSIINGGEEPTGRLPFGDVFKIVLDETSESEGTAEFALYFRFCRRGFIGLGCTPYFLGPIPMPVLNSKEKGMVLTGFLDGLGGITSGIEAPKAWEEMKPAMPQEVRNVLDQYGANSRRGRGSRSLCGEGPGGINFKALAESIHQIESNVGGDPYTVPGGLYVDGGPYGYPNERGYALGRYQYMSYRSDVAAIISAKSGGSAFLNRTFNGQQPTPEEIANYFPPEAQDALFVEDQTNTIQSLINQGYSGDRILEILGQMHFGGAGVLTNGTLDSKSVSDGFGTVSMWEYGQRTKEVYYQELESSGEDSKCGEATGNFIMPINGSTKTSDYGFRIHPIWGDRRFHAGVDYGAVTGQSIFASDGGVVFLSGTKGGYGLTVEIDHGNGLSTLYAHLSQLLVKEGDEVAQGDEIGLAGSTGDSTGPHLHFEIRDTAGNPLDPKDYLPQ